MASPESCEQEASLSTSFDTASHTNTSILASKKNGFPPKKMRWIGVVVASQNVAPKAVRALVMFLAIACCQLTVGSSNLSVLAGKIQVSYNCYICPMSIMTYLHSFGPRHPCSSLFASVTAPLKQIKKKKKKKHFKIIKQINQTNQKNVHSEKSHLRTQHISEEEYLMSVLLG